MLKKSLATVLMVTMLASSNISAMEIDRSNLFVPSSLGSLKVLHDENGFSILKNGEIVPVQNCFVDKEVRNITSEQLNRFLGNVKTVIIGGETAVCTRIVNPKEIIKLNRIENRVEFSEDESEDLIEQLSGPAGYLAIVQLDDGEYTIHAKQRLNGGGPFFAAIGYWAVKLTGYTSVGATIGFNVPAGVTLAAVGAPAVAPIAAAVVGTVETAAAATGAALLAIPFLP